jgi:hypothetical protein
MGGTLHCATVGRQSRVPQAASQPAAGCQFRGTLSDLVVCRKSRVARMSPSIRRSWCGLGVGLGLGRTSSLLYAWSEMYTQSLHL